MSGSFWPSPVQEALLRVAFGRAESVPRLWRELEPLRIEVLETGSLCLLPIVYASLEDTDVGGGALRRLKGSYQSVWYRNQLQLDRLPDLANGLRGEGVEPLLIGGAALAALHYPQLGLRPIVQLEVAVAPFDGPRARRALERLGWRRVGGTPGLARLVAADGAVRAFLHEGAPPFFAGPLTPGEALERLRLRSSRRPVGGCSVHVLDPTDELLVACALGARRIVPQSPQWLVDTHRILLSGAVEPDSLASAAATFRLVPAVRDTLSYLERVSETIDPAPYLAALARRPIPRRDVLVHELAGAGRGRFGGVPSPLVSHARATIAMPLPRALAGLPRAFRTAWELEDARRLALVAARKAIARLTRVRAGGAPVDGIQAPVSLDSRNRSASS